jgi:hypothetical protein
MPTKERVETEEDGALPIVNTHSVSTDRTVFTEEGNDDGWISTDVTVEIRR